MERDLGELGFHSLSLEDMRPKPPEAKCPPKVTGSIGDRLHVSWLQFRTLFSVSSSKDGFRKGEEGDRPWGKADSDVGLAEDLFRKQNAQL